MTDNAERLEPCPWCGSDMSSFMAAADGCCTSSNGSLYVPCDCGAIGPEGKTVAGAIAAWNRRAPAEAGALSDDAFNTAWDAVDWDVWRKRPVRELVRHLMLAAAPAAPKED